MLPRGIEGHFGFCSGSDPANLNPFGVGQVSGARITADWLSFRGHGVVREVKSGRSLETQEEEETAASDTLFQDI